MRAWPYLLVAFLYVATWPYHSGLNNPNEMVRVYMTKAWVDKGTFAIDSVLGAWGPVDDKAIREGKLYSSKAPLQSLVGIPAYQAAPTVLRVLGAEPTKRHLTQVLRLFGSALWGWILAAALLAWSRKRATDLHADPALGTAVGLTLALGTMLYPYALTFTGHELAALTAGGAYLVALLQSQSTPRTRAWRLWAILLGFLAANAPFAEYPSALVAGPAVLATFFIAPTWRDRAEQTLWGLLGGAAPFALGLWAHHRLWGSPLKTGYSFLENTSYVEVHGEGFFGVSAPKIEALGGALFSPGTGLFFFSPILLLGLAALLLRCFRRGEPGELPRALAWAALVGFILEVLFIAGHKGWRGGWTVGPRYIIAVAPLLGLWVVEALAIPRIRAFAATVGALSILLTGYASALYPHLSDVYINPLKTFLWPSYQEGFSTYGLADSLGLQGSAANWLHLIPLTGALLWVATAGTDADHDVSRFFALRSRPWLRRAVILCFTFALGLGIVAVIPEKDPAAALNETRRLWGFWEPARPGGSPLGRPAPEPGLLFRARDRWREITVKAHGPQDIRGCLPEGLSCRYGDQPWQHFGPEHLEYQGQREPILFMHPILETRIVATIPVPANAQRGKLFFGLADASVQSDNPHPVELTLTQGDKTLVVDDAGDRMGLERRTFTLTSTQPLQLQIQCEKDGARVFGFDLELY